MTNVVVSGIPAIAWSVGFIVVAAVPVWFAAQVTGAAQATLLRSIAALLAGVLGSIVGLFIGGPAVLLIAPLAFLFSFKFILDMSFPGALMLGILAIIGYALMFKFIGGGFSAKEEASARWEATRPALTAMEAAGYRYESKSFMALTAA